MKWIQNDWKTRPKFDKSQGTWEISRYKQMQFSGYLSHILCFSLSPESRNEQIIGFAYWKPLKVQIVERVVEMPQVHTSSV